MSDNDKAPTMECARCHRQFPVAEQHPVKYWLCPECAADEATS